VAGRPFAHWAGELMDLATRGLEQHEPQARFLLDPAVAVVEQGRSPAREIIDAWRADPRPEQLVDFITIE
jgi:hypothetical protein